VVDESTDVAQLEELFMVLKQRVLQSSFGIISYA
jgi:hypothetical protein